MPSSTGCPRASRRAGAAPAGDRPDDVPIYVPPSPLPPPGRAGRATRAKGAPASEVLGPLRGVPGRAPRRPGGGRMAGAGVTVMATRATLPVLRALLDQARRKNFSSGVLGVRARPEWAGGGGVPARRRAGAGGAVRVGAGRPRGAARAGRRAVAGRAHRPPGRRSRRRGAQPPGVAPAADPGPVGRGPAAVRRHRRGARADRRGRGPGRRDRAADGRAAGRVAAGPRRGADP